MRLLRIWVVSSRPLSWVNTAFPFALAYYAVTREVDLWWVIGSVFFLVPYNFLMYGINDVFDYESDVRNPRKGGIEGALLPPETHTATVIASTLLPVPFVAALVAVGSIEATGVLALALLSVVVYSAKHVRFKEVPVLDSITSSLHFVLPALYGILLAGGRVDALAFSLILAFFFWGMASHAFGAVQDVLADRDAGVASIATAIGAKNTVRLAWGLYAAAGTVMAFTPWPLSLIGLAALGYLAAISPWWSVSDEASPSANRGWRWFLLLNFLSGALVVLVTLEWWRLHP